MGGSAKKSVVGHRYYRTMLLGICHGPIDAIRSVWIKDKRAWAGNLRINESGVSATNYIDQKGLFGGDDLEGGVVGWFELGHGAFNQTLMGINSDGTSTTAPLMAMGITRPNQPPLGTHYRGMAVINFHDFYWGTNPYLSDIAIEVERYFNAWYPERAKIGVDANPAHIIYESVTSDQWGLGYSPSEIDLDALAVGAAKLYNEALGLSMAWSEQQTIQDFIGTILDQIDGSFYYSTRTGKWTLKLVRSGDPVALTLDPDNCKLVTFTRKALGETVNELTAQWVNPETEEFQAITAQDTANIMSTGQTIAGSKNYPGVRNEALAGRLAIRDLRAISATLAAAEVIANREAWSLNPGDVVDFNWPAHGISSLRMRVTSTTHTQTSPDIKISLIEDVFGQDTASFTGTNTPGWVDTRQEATQFDVLAAFELPFWYVFQATSGVVPAPEVTYGSVLPVTINDGVQSAELYAERQLISSTEYERVDSGNRTPSALLNTVLTRAVSSNTSVVLSSLTGAALIEADTFAVIGSGEGAEMVRVVGDFAATGFILQRGLMDTHPQAWPLGTRIYFLGTTQFPADETARSMAELVNYKVTMQTSISATDVDDVPVTPLALIGRQGRPYSVANVTIGGAYWPTSVVNTDGYLNVSWSTRNRLLQNGDVQVQWSEPSIAPELGSSVLVFAMQGGAVVSSVLVESPTTNTAMLPLGGLPAGVTTIVVRTLRDDLDNYQDYSHTFTLTAELLTGWGADYGADYGD
jgi:hypothetical protein